MNIFPTLFAALDLTGIQETTADQPRIESIVNTVLMIMGGTAVLIIVISGIRLIYNQGNPNETATARNSILYAVAGLIVIVAAYAIVNFVITGVTSE